MDITPVAKDVDIKKNLVIAYNSAISRSWHGIGPWSTKIKNQKENKPPHDIIPVKTYKTLML